MITNPDCPNRTFYQYSAVLLTLCALTGCDAFLVSICEFEERPACTADASPGSDLASKPNTDGGQVPTIVERKFVYQASQTIDDKHQFVGIVNGKLIMLATDGSRLSWEAWKLDVNTYRGKNKFMVAGVEECPNFPGGFMFGKDDIYIVDREFYYFQHSGGQNIFKLGKDVMPMKIPGVQLTSSRQPRVFTHPSISALAVVVQSGVPSTNSTFIQLDTNQRLEYGTGKIPTAFAIGELDSIDLLNNGQEIVIFDGGNLKSILHWNPNNLFDRGDSPLITSLSSAIGRTALGSTSSINAAFITNLNHDNLTDFVYARNGIIYVTSYLGRDKATPPNFKDWETQIPKLPGEEIKSLIAVELTNDEYPELVVETDQAVHFYLNTP